MTDEVAPNTAQEVEVPSDAETAFIVIKNQDGTWKATVDVGSTFTIERPASRSDVKSGTREIYEFLSEDDIARYTAARISAENATDTQRATEGVRQALSNRDIL
jgi:hypothetical protein